MFVDLSPVLRKGSGVLSVSREGEPMKLYKDPKLSMITGALKIGRDLYYVSLAKDCISRISVEEDVARK